LKQEIAAILHDAPAGTKQLEVEFESNGSAAPNPALAGKKVLVVDDDIRNIFALTALLERQLMEVVAVDSGQEALDVLRQRDDIDVALVDVMMPEMDGYMTMTEMRKIPAFAGLPIIALTAKAMKGDREKCIEAGASDYIAKPINNARLLSMLEHWLEQ
jgi:CheY-like chemotaxis protein